MKEQFQCGLKRGLVLSAWVNPRRLEEKRSRVLPGTLPDMEPESAALRNMIWGSLTRGQFVKPRRRFVLQTMRKDRIQ